MFVFFGFTETVSRASVIGLMADSQAATNTSLIIALVCCAIYLPILIVLSGIVRSYTASAWTLTYLRLTTTPPPPPELELPAA